MNITNQHQCMEEWEKEYLRTGNDSFIPEEDRERVLREVDALYADMYDILVLCGQVPCV